jgi:SAM-dependent methyltransferase
MTTPVTVLRTRSTTPRVLSARLEPFDSYWQAPADIEKGYTSFASYYRANYLPHMPADKGARILVISCGPGYLVDLLLKNGYTNVFGIDSDASKIAHAKRRNLPCDTAQAFPYLEGREAEFDMIIPEQELNHLTLDETVDFLKLCHVALKPGGRIVTYAVSGANPLVGSESLAQNIDHFYTVTEYSLTQIMELGGFTRIKPFPLKLYVFWTNPFNYVGLVATGFLELVMRVIFRLYGKKVGILTKKIGSVAYRPA